MYIRLASLISIIRIPGLSGSDRSVVNQLEKVLSIAGNDSQLLAVLAHSIELVCERSLQLLAGDVGQLGFGDQRLGLGAHEFLLENDNLGRIGLLVLQLCDLIGDLLLACTLVSLGQVVRGRGNLRSRLGWTEASMLRMLLIVTRY